MGLVVLPEQATAPTAEHQGLPELLRRRRTVFLNVFVTVLVVGALMAASAKPVYQTSAELQFPATPLPGA